MAAAAPANATSTKKKTYPFYLGGLAAASAATITHPLDLTRYRLQTATGKTSALGSIVNTAKSEGPRGLWHGLTATWLRQFSYSVTRFAIYEYVKGQFTEGPSASHPTGKTPTTGQLAISAAAAGAVAGITGNPAELVLVRTCGDLNRPRPDRYAYGNALNGLVRIARDEGIGRMFLGVGPNVVRSVVMNVGQLASYDVFKGMLSTALGLKDGPQLQFIASFAAGTFATTCCTPVDVIKSRVQNSRSSEGVMTVLRTALKNEGPRVLMKGWFPAWIRLQPQTTLLFMFFEQYKSLVDKYRGSI